MCAVVETKLRERPQPVAETIRIVDMGCGSGRLMGLLQMRLAKEFPSLHFEIYGFDVMESKVQPESFFHDCLDFLSSVDPKIDWLKRVSVISVAEQWPFADSSVDFVLSNQVLEHVNDHQRVFAEIARVLKPKGVSAHIFPLRSCYQELHVKLPFAHWVRPDNTLVSYIKFCSLLGMGTWKRYRKTQSSVSLDVFARMNRDFIAFDTNYIDEKDILALSKQARLLPSYEFTECLYVNKFRSIFARPLVYNLRPPLSIWAVLRFKLLKRVSGITLTLSKDNTYVNHGFHTA
jgi:ubiquinone/menaquinone biosynthesis C-methylase UbiE